MTKQSARLRVARVLKTFRGRWVSVLALVTVAPCRYGQAISELRAEGLTIENEVRQVRGGRQSFYRLVPTKS